MHLHGVNSSKPGRLRSKIDWNVDKVETSIAARSTVLRGSPLFGSSKLRGCCKRGNHFDSSTPQACRDCTSRGHFQESRRLEGQLSDSRGTPAVGFAASQWFGALSALEAQARFQAMDATSRAFRVTRTQHLDWDPGPLL